MSFKFFRKHQKVMLWIVVVITIFTFSLFSVTSTLRTCFKQDDKPTALGHFTSRDGSQVEISLRDYYHAADLHRRIKGKVVEDEVISHILMKHEADRGGVIISDGELTEIVKAFFPSLDDYNNFIRQGRFESKQQFEESLREVSQVERYKEFIKLPDELITSETLYEKWKLENEEFKLDYVAFPHDAYGKDIAADTLAQDDLVAYYDGLAETSPEVREHFSEAEKFEFDVAYLDLASADFAGFEELMEDVDIQEHELNRHYNNTKERFLIETPEEPEETPEPAEGDEPAEGEESSEGEETEAEEPAPEYQPLEDVREQVEKEVKLAKLVEKACYEWTDYARQEKIIGKTKAQIEEEEAAKEKTEDEKAGEEGEAGDEEETAEKKTHGEFYQSILGKYKLLTDRIEGPVSLDDLEDLEKYGCEELKMRARYLKENNAVYVRPNEKHPTMAAFVKVTTYVKRRKKALEEVREAAVDRYILTKKQELAEAALQSFTDELEAKARDLEEVKQVIDQWTEDAKMKAAESLNLPEGTSAEEAKKQQELAESRELLKIEREVDTLLKRYTGRFFSEQAAAQGLTVEVFDYFRKSDTRKPEFLEMEPSPERFIKGNPRIFDMDTDAIADPLNDREASCSYCVHIADRRFPEPSGMTEEDYLSTKMTIEQERRTREYQRRMEMMNPDMKRPRMPMQPEEEKERDPFTIQSLMEDYALTLYKQEEPAEGEAPADTENQ